MKSKAVLIVGVVAAAAWLAWSIQYNNSAWRSATQAQETLEQCREEQSKVLSFAKANELGLVVFDSDKAPLQSANQIKSQLRIATGKMTQPISLTQESNDVNRWAFDLQNAEVSMAQIIAVLGAVSDPEKGLGIKQIQLSKSASGQGSGTQEKWSTNITFFFMNRSK